MVSELSFLIELLLNHRLQKGTKDAIAARIKDVEGRVSTSVPIASPHLRPVVPGMAVQSPSTQAILDRNPDLAAVIPQPVAVVAQTQAAAEAMASRQRAISQSASSRPLLGKPEEGRTSPRKF